MSPHLVDDLGGLREILTHVADYVIVVDDQRKIRYINRVEEGYEMDDVLGAPAQEFIRPESADAFRKAMDAAYHDGEASGYDFNAVDPTGSDLWFRSRLFPIRREGRTVAVVILASDITELKRAEAEARELRRLLPVCSWCDRIRNDEGAWEEVSLYLKRETGTAVSHSLCPDCSERHMGEVAEGG